MAASRKKAKVNRAFRKVITLRAFCALLLLTTFAMVATRLLSGAIGAYAVQSLVLGLVAAVVAYFTGSSDLYIVAVLTIIVKCGSPSFCVILEGGNRS